MPKKLTDAQRVRNLREKMGWSQSRLAREIGCDKTTVSRWESGQRRPTGISRKALDDAGW